MSSSDSEDDTFDLSVLEAAPVVIKHVKLKDGQDEVTVKHKPLPPEQIDCIAKEFSHPKVMGLGPFLMPMTHKTKLHTATVVKNVSHGSESKQSGGTRDNACHYCGKMGPCTCKKKKSKAKSKVSVGKTQSNSVGGAVIPKVKSKLVKLIQKATLFSAIPTEKDQLK